MGDLKIPKESMIIENSETHEIIAQHGKWKRLPMDGEPLVAHYRQNFQKYHE